LREIAEEECGKVEALGRTGRRLLWERDRRAILDDLDACLRADEKKRAEESRVVVATELAFGMRDSPLPAVAVPLSDGRVVRFRGSADRVDRRADGVLVVVDYKTGSPLPYEGLCGEEPTGRGSRLQLPVYAYAAGAAYGDEHEVDVGYWFVGRGANRWIGYRFTDAAAALVDAALRAVVDGIEAGVFPGHPAPPGGRPGYVPCRYCDPDGLGTRDRWREWERKRDAPELAGYIALVDPDVGPAEVTA
jgi:hypothetical protein